MNQTENKQTALSVLLVDDHPVFRLGMANAIRSVPDIHISEADTLETAKTILLEKAIDLAFIDISLKEESGLDLCSWIVTNEIPTIPVILSMHAEKAYVRKAYEMGARGYILKDSPLELLRTIIQTFPDLDAFVTHPALRITEESSAEDGKLLKQYNSLTQREKQVFTLLAQGYNYKEIAFELMIREKTASVHRYNIIQKMELGDQASIIRAALVVGVLEYQNLVQGPNFTGPHSGVK